MLGFGAISESPLSGLTATVVAVVAIVAIAVTGQENQSVSSQQVTSRMVSGGSSQPQKYIVREQERITASVSTAQTKQNKDIKTTLKIVSSANTYTLAGSSNGLADSVDHEIDDFLMMLILQ